MGRARQLAGRGNNYSIILDSSAADTDIGERLVLNGTNDSSLNAGFSILQEDETDNADVRITSQLHNGVFNFTSVPKNDNNPAFYVTTLTNDNNAEHAYSKILYDVVHFDTTNDWDLTNYQYNPSVAGYYHFYMQWSEISLGDVFDIIGGIGKGSSVVDNVNASSGFGRKRLTGVTNFDWYASTVCAETILFMNGDDEYVQGWVYGNSAQGSTVQLQGNGRATFFGGHLITRRDSSNFLDFTNSGKNYNQ